MGRQLEIITPLHKQASRDYLGRMQDEKIHCMVKARDYEYDYWDGDRRYGYGGYSYDGRWRAVAERLVEVYDLPPDAAILDVGCGKGYLLYEFTQVLDRCTVVGLDRSRHALADAKPEIASCLLHHHAEAPYPFEDDRFDLVFSNTTLHNLTLPQLEPAVREIQRVGRNKFINVESYRNEAELFNLQCWALTCESFFRPEEWLWLYERFGYTGDYEFIFFQ